MISTPILLITFNRPNHVRQVLSAIRKQSPFVLFISQDGPREGNEEDVERIKEVRRVIEESVDWPCDVHTLFQEKNLGCGPGPAAGIDWFFDYVDKGIIIEDDAVPGDDFFEYASVLLEKYESDESVRAIGSMNIDDNHWGDGSYYFSMMNRNLCAWATWKRAWKSFDIGMEGVSRRKLRKVLREYGVDAMEREYWLDRLDEIHENLCEGKSWDTQFYMSIWLNHGKGIIPSVNLSSNIGTVGEATHQMAPGNVIDCIPVCPILPLVHPSSCEVQSAADRQFYIKYYEPWKKNWSIPYRLYNLLNRRVKRVLGIKGPILKKRIKKVLFIW